MHPIDPLKELKAKADNAKSICDYLTNCKNKTRRWEIAQRLVEIGFDFVEDNFLSSVEFDHEIRTKNGWVLGFVSPGDLVIVHHPLASFEGLAFSGEELTESFVQRILDILA